MTGRQLIRLLVSVRSADEAIDALHGGADMIDIKDPSRGSLGAADNKIIQSILAAVGDSRPVSVAMGELHESPAAMTIPGVQFVKVGLASAPRDWPVQLGAYFAASQPAQPIAVAYADYERVKAPMLRDVLKWAGAHQAAGLLIDTAIKDGRNLFHWIDESLLTTVIERAHEAGLIVALAGSLKVQDVPRCVPLQPDVIAVRGGVCAGAQRDGAIDRDRVREIADIIASYNISTDARAN